MTGLSRRIAIGSLGWCLLSAGLAAVPQATNTASVSGVVVDAQTSEPVRHASVTIRASNLSPVNRINTDDQGRFRLDAVAAGRYALYVSHRQYPDMQYGASKPGGPGTMIAVTEGREITNLIVRVVRGAVISGVVSRPGGGPLSDVTVQLWRWGYSPRTGERTLVSVPGGWSETDDRGSYRFFAIPAGTYVVGTTGERIGNGVRGRISIDGEVRALTRADVAAALGGVSPTPARPPGQVSAAIAAPRTRSAPTFYPGSTRTSEAGLVSVAAGEERTDLDFALQTVPAAVVRVKVVAPSGPAPVRTQVHLFQIGGEATGRADMDFARREEDDGTLTFSDIPPGDYVLGAQALMSEGGPLSATSAVTVDGSGARDVILALEPGVTVSGRVLFEGDRPDQRLLTTLRLGVSAVVSKTEVNIGVGPVPIDAEGRFTIDGVPPGRYLVEFTSTDDRGIAWRGWWLKSAMVNEHDAADAPIDIPRAGVPNIVVTVSHRPSELSGTLLDSAGEPSPAHWVVVFSTDRTFWRPGSRRIAGMRTGAGTFAFANLPPGDYFVAALADVEAGQWFDRAFLQELAATSPIRITIGEGEKKALDLRVR